MTEALMKKKAVVDDAKLLAIKWIDNRSVIILTTYDFLQQVKSVKRWNKIEIYPAAIGNYNKHIGGVDLLDPFLSCYRIHVHSKNSYHRLLWHYFDLSLVQEWLLHKRLLEDEAMSLNKFKISVANALILGGKVKWKRGRPSLTQLESFFRKKRERDLQHHFQIHQLDWVMLITGLNLPVKMEGVNCQGIRVFRNFFAQNIKCIFA